ncbi:MAG: SCP2 sterol-binding domain-containing protein [Chloroflexota bacterium]
MAEGFGQKLALIGLYAGLKIRHALGMGMKGGTQQRGCQETPQDLFGRLPGLLVPEAAAGVDAVFQFRLSGPGGGDWNVQVKDGICRVNPGLHSSPTSTMSMTDEDFVALMTGGQFMATAMQAYTAGKLKVEGDLMKLQLIPKLFKL